MENILEIIKGKLTDDEFKKLEDYINIQNAISQFTGYRECEHGNVDIQTLCSNMGLMENEFHYITENYGFVIDPYIKEIKTYFGQ